MLLSLAVENPQPHLHTIKHQFRIFIHFFHSKMSTLMKQQLRDIFGAAVRAVQPEKLIQNSVKLIDNNLQIKNSTFPLGERVYLVGFGKAVMGMAQTLETLLGDRLTGGIVSVPVGSIKNHDQTTSVDGAKPRGLISYRENSPNNQPDLRTLKTTQDIVEMVGKLNKNDTLIVVISGGGSALLSMPRPTVSLDMKLELCKKLFNLGADITEVNLIRQKLSMVKAGGLACMAYPASVLGLILSDIIGDPVELIASGPTVNNSTASKNIPKILEKYKLNGKIDKNLEKILTTDENDNLKNNNFSHIHNFIIGNNLLAIEAAKIECDRKNLISIVLVNDIQGSVIKVSSMYAKICGLICKVWNKSLSKENFIKLFSTSTELLLLNKRANEIHEATLEAVSGDGGLLLIAGGEPSIVVRGCGKGGRNQQLALTFSLDWLKATEESKELSEFEVMFLSAGTDGQDGPTDAAGAFGYAQISSTIIRLLDRVYCAYREEEEDNSTEEKEIKKVMLNKIQKIIPEHVLNNNDTYNFYSKFKKGEDLVKTGITGTNVMDIHLIYIKKRFELSSKSPDYSLIENHNFF